MNKLIIISFNDMLISHKLDIVTSLVKEQKVLISPSVGFIDNDSRTDSIGELTREIQGDEELTGIVFVIDKDLSVSDDILKLISENTGKPYIAYKYDYGSKYNNLKQKLYLISENSKEDIYEKVFSMYSSGFSKESISEHLEGTGLSFDDFMITVISKNTKGNSSRLSEELKKVISNRDKSGVARKTIAKELGINYKTVQRSCEKYGNPNKNMDRVDDEDVLEFVTDEFNFVGDSLICPKCKNKTNKIDNGWSLNNRYCKNCLEEYVILDKGNKKSCYRVKWENIN